MTSLLACGASCGITAQTGTGPGEISHLLLVNGAARTRVSDASFASGFAWQQQNAAAANSYSEFGASGTRRSGIVRIEIPTIYSGTQEILTITTAGGATGRIRATNGVTEAIVAGGTGVNGPTLTAGTAYLIRWEFDVSGTPTIKWSIDGVAQTDATGGAATTLSRIRLGAGNTPAAQTTLLWGDLWITDGTGTGFTHPLAEVRVTAVRPNADGTHSFTLGDMRDAAGSNIAVAATNVNTYLEEDPPTITERVQQNVVRTTGYVEIDFASTSETSAPLMVELVALLSASGTGVCTQKAALNDGGSVTDAYALSTVGSTSVVGMQGCYDTRPNGGGAWDLTSLNALKARWGYSSDINPVPYLAGFIIEAVFPVATGTTHDGALSVAGAGTATFTGSIVKEGDVDPSGTGTLAQPGALLLGGAWARSGTGAISEAANMTHGGTLAPTGTGAVTQGGGLYLPGSLSVSGAGTISLGGTVVKPGQVSVTGTGAATFGGTATLGAAISPAGSGAFAPTANMTHGAALAATGTGSLTQGPSDVEQGSLSVAATGALGAAGGLYLPGGASLTGTGALGPTASLRHGGTFAPTGSGSLGLTGGRLVSGSLGLAGAGTLAQDGLVSNLSSISLTGSGALALGGSVARGGAVSVAGSGALSQSAGLKLPGGLVTGGTGSFALQPGIAMSTTLGSAGAGTLTLVGDLLAPYVPLDPGAYASVTLAGASGIVRLVQTDVRLQGASTKVRVV